LRSLISLAIFDAADDLAFLVPNRGYRQGDVQQAAIFAPPDCFIVLDSLTVANLVQNKRLFIKNDLAE